MGIGRAKTAPEGDNCRGSRERWDRWTHFMLGSRCCICGFQYSKIHIDYEKSLPETQQTKVRHTGLPIYCKHMEELDVIVFF